MILGAGFFLTFSNSITQIHRYRTGHGLPTIQNRASVAVRAAGMTVMIAAGTILTSAIITPEVSGRTLFYELTMWGGGHILQFANVLGMITVWLILAKKITGIEAVSEKMKRGLIWVLALPAALSPLLMIQGTTSQLYYAGFTQLMRWFIFPVVTVYLILVIRAIWKNRRVGRPIRFTDFKPLLQRIFCERAADCNRIYSRSDDPGIQHADSRPLPCIPWRSYCGLHDHGLHHDERIRIYGKKAKEHSPG
jgi:hypothetical protein